jgi:Phytanoyl-CoA dioxygenase (PhyH)
MSQSANTILSKEQVSKFHAQGYLLLPDFYSLQSIKFVCQGIYKVIGQVMCMHGIEDHRPSFCMDSFDAGYNDLIRQNRKIGSQVYDAVKFIPEFWSLVADSVHSKLMQELRAGSIPAMAATGCGIRIDNPSEDQYRALWHQEYPAQLRSLDGLVFWSPLLPVTQDSGPVSIGIGSHKAGLLPVERLDSASGRSGAYALRLAREEQLIKNYTHIAPLTSPCDLLVMDFLTLHASGFNRAQRSRWSMQFRYFNMVESTGMAHGWSGSYAEGIDFTHIHPELVVQK